MTPEQISAELSRLAALALAEIMALIRQGTPSRDAIEQIARQFADQAMDGFEQALSDALSGAIGVADIREYPIGDVVLSERLYAYAHEVSTVARTIIQQQANEFQSVRELALQLYEGYGVKPKEREILQYKASNPKLPKYLRVLLGDPDVGPSLQSAIARIQVGNLKTPALRAGYLELIDAIEKGAGMARLEKRLNVAFAERMRYFANRIARTELHRVAMEQQAREWMSPQGSWLKFVRWRLSQKHPKMDICDLHASIDKYGLGPGVYPKERAPLPPAHPHCLPGDTLITACGRISAVSKRWFDGDLVVITTASGKRLSATINHPVLTPGGWVGIGCLHIGDQVVSCVAPVEIIPLPFLDNKHQNIPSSISEIADTFSRSSEVASREMPLTAEDFHGDGIDGKVAVIWSYRELWDWVDSDASEIGTDHFLNKSRAALARLFGDGHFNLGLKTLGLSANGGMGGLDPFEPSFRGDVGDFQPLSGGHAARRYPFFDKSGIDWSSPDVVFLGKAENGTARDIFLDEVINVEIEPFSGHVFNLQTDQGHYTANSIITHNCYCTLHPVIDLPPSAKAREKENAELRWLSRQSAADQALVMGSRDKAQRALDGEPIPDIMDEGKPEPYRLKRVGEV